MTKELRRQAELFDWSPSLRILILGAATEIECLEAACREKDELIQKQFSESLKDAKRIAELEATVERLTKSLFKAGEQLDAKEAENQKLAELLDQAPHEAMCVSLGFDNGLCDCWKKEADALLKM